MTSRIKTTLLGSAAAILATGAAQAADLPVKKAAAAVQYVEVCPAYGTGFYRLPGTDICIRHFGSMKFNFGIQDERTLFDGADDEFVVEDGASNTTGWQWTVRPGWDFRSPTELGTLRAVVQLRVDQRNGIFEGAEPEQTGDMRTSNLAHRAYIEWAGFLIGRAGTQFTYWDQDDVVSAIGGSPKASAMQVTYTFAFPGGMKATIGLEDAEVWQSSAGLSDLSGLDVSDEGPQRFYDVVLTLSTEQAWGNAKIAALIHQIHTNADLNGNGASDTSETGTGWAVLGGITFNLPTLGQGDQLLLEATYCDGVVAGCGLNGGAANNATSFERSGQFLEGLNRDDFDAFIVASGATWDFETTKAWSVIGQFRHYWAPLWRTNIHAGYSSVDVPDIAEATPLDDGGLGDANIFDIGVNLIWGRSRRTAEIGVEVLYKKVDQELPAGTVLPAGVEEDPDGWAAVAFISRSW